MQGLPSLQVTLGPLAQEPAAHVSPCVHALPSLQGAVLLALTQPVAMLQLSEVHRLLSLQSMVAPEWQLPPAQTSPLVQALLSSQAMVKLLCTQPALVSHESVVHGLLSSQLGADAPGWQALAEQMSPSVQALPSEQLLLLGVNAHPPTLLQLSDVHGLLSLHAWPGPDTQVPPPQTSGVVQSLPSEQGSVLLLLTQPLPALHESLVHRLLSSQFSAVPGTQLPPEQASPSVHALLSVHEPACGVATQPEFGSQLSVVHGLPSLQTMVAPGAQAELAQPSPEVHALPSLHGRLLAVNTQPDAGLHASLVQRLLSLQTVEGPAMQAPPEQASPTVQTLPSEQLAVVLVKTQPVLELHVSDVQGLLSLQISAAPGWHAPPAHASPWVHALPSEQPLVLNAWTQPPLMLQESVVHGLPSSQPTAAPGWHAPLAQTSPLVHALLSEHVAALLLWTQPLVGSQISSVHGLLSLQLTIVPGWHAPVAQTSPLVHALLSEQASVLLLCTQPFVALHESVVHGLLSSQPSAAPGTHAPPAHASLTVHVLPSEQACVLLVNTQPLAALQTSLVQGLPSLQVTVAPGTQEPPPQVSPCVQALPSLHGTVLLTCVQPFCVSQSSEVQGLPSSHGATVPPVHTPSRHLSFNVQELPSSQVAVFGVNTQPVAALQESSVQGLPSAQGSVLPGTQTPPEHWSPNVQTLPSEQEAVVGLFKQPATGSQVSAVHGFLSSQLATAPGTHAPPLHTSLTVHPLLSLQPSLLSRKVHPPVASHVSVVQGLPSLQGSDAPGMHAPPAHRSPWVHTLPSLHARVLLVVTQPSFASQDSVVQRLPSSQVVAAPGRQTPSEHASPTVQALPSLQLSVVGVNTQPPVCEQLSAVHGLPSLQGVVVPGVQMPPPHTSPTVQELPSEQERMLYVVTQPLTGSHASVVQTLPSSQVLDAPGTHSPLTHASPTVQTLPSVQASVVMVLTQPMVGSHESLVHGLPSLHAGAEPPMHAPFVQTSPTVHALPSEQPESAGWNTQPFSGSQKSTVQGFSSAQTVIAPGKQTPAVHLSPFVHALPSLQVGAPLPDTQPWTESQTRSVHTPAAAQSFITPAWHAPLTHSSPTVHALPSSQGAALLADWQPSCGKQ